MEVIEADRDHPDGFIHQLLTSGEADSKKVGMSNSVKGKPQALLSLELSDSNLIDLQSTAPEPNLSTPGKISTFTSSVDTSFQAISLSPVKARSHTTAGDDFNGRMRTAAIMLAQLNNPKTFVHPNAQKQIREKIIHEMMALEESRIAKAGSAVLNPSELDGGSVIEEQNILNDMKQLKDDPSGIALDGGGNYNLFLMLLAAVFREDFNAKRDRIRAASPYGSHSNWRLLSVIVKCGDDLRQEQLACQLVKEMGAIWKQEKVDAWVY